MPLPNLVSTIKDEAGKIAAWIIKDLGYLDGGVPEIQEVPIETPESSPRVLDAGVVPGVMLKEGELPEDSPLTKGKRIPPPIPERPVTKKAPPKKKASAKKKPIKPSTYKRKKK